MDEMIEVGSVYKRFGAVTALQDISFTVAKSELTVLIGPSGCGKSTLLRCLNGLETFDSGHVRIGNITLERHNPRQSKDLNANLRELRKEVGMVFQAFNLFPHLTVLENAVRAPMIVKGLSRKKAEEWAYELLVKVGLEDRAHYYPSQLSGGQQQRAAIARALAMSPRVMLYDEPTSALDPGLVGEVLQIMRKLDDEGMTQLIVTHEMRFAREAGDRIIFLHNGEIVESGPPEQMFTSPRDERTRQFLRNYFQ